MTIKSINIILAYVVFVSFAFCVVYSIWGGLIAYGEYVKGKLKSGIAQFIFSLSVFAMEIFGAAVAFFYKDSSVKILPINIVLVVNAIACATFFSFIYINWRRLLSNGKKYALYIITSRRIVFAHVVILIMATAVSLNILDASRSTQAFSVNFSGNSRNAHIFFAGHTGLKYSNREGKFIKNDDERYGIVLKLENNELFPLNVTVHTHISTDKPIRMQMPEDFEKYRTLPAFSYSDSVSSLGSSNIPIFFAEREIPDLITKLIRSGKGPQGRPLSFHAVSRVEIDSRRDVGLSDVYYINSHIYVTTETISIGGLDVLVPAVFGEGVSINSAVSVDRRLDKDNVTIDRYYDLLSYSCQPVGSEYELLLVIPSVQHNIPKDEANDIVSGKNIGRINTDCIYVVQELNKLENDKARAAIQFLESSRRTSTIRVN